MSRSRVYRHQQGAQACERIVLLGLLLTTLEPLHPNAHTHVSVPISCSLQCCLQAGSTPSR